MTTAQIMRFAIIIIIVLLIGLIGGLFSRFLDARSRGASDVAGTMFMIIIALLMGGLLSGFLHSKAAGCATMVIFGLLLLSLAIWSLSQYGAYWIPRG
jgi:hypothetical protein